MCDIWKARKMAHNLFSVAAQGGHGGVYVKSLINKLNRLESGNVTNLGEHEVGFLDGGRGVKVVAICAS